MSDLTESQTSRQMTMKDTIVSLLVAKVNLSQDKAEQVFDLVMTYIKDHPHQLISYVGKLRTGSKSRMEGFFN